MIYQETLINHWNLIKKAKLSLIDYVLDIIDYEKIWKEQTKLIHELDEELFQIKVRIETTVGP